MKLGIDIGSTTIKCALLDEDKQLVYSSYQRHSCQITEKLLELLDTMKKQFNLDEIELAVSGSAGMGLCDQMSIPFVQEVYATRIAASVYMNEPDCIIELGGEDAKILFLSNGIEVRMNGTCAGGTGAFIDQMAQLLNMEAEEMNEAAKKHQKLYTIASRCGVFAKSDVQPLINQGASKEDLAASIYHAVVNQTIGGLAQGRKISGNVVYLGGPLTFNSELRKAFDEVLKVEGACPENSLYYVAMGTAILAEEKQNLNELIDKLKHSSVSMNYHALKPLFENEEEYIKFKKRHDQAKVNVYQLEKISGDVVLGIDAGSTTLKLVLINKNQEIVYSSYRSNQGNTLFLVKEELEALYQNNPDMKIISSCVTGYGEDLIRNAFGVDFGLVETMAHFSASKKFMPDVDFIIDIGGQDIKCFKIQNGTIDNLFLNEACSSGCGSFLQTFANALNYDIEEFSRLGLFAKHPVDLGSRCTVFMNSSVKQAQKDGATIEDISAGLSISVVKNALYKVIRTANAKELGKHIITQGGTFYNDAVLRAFEMELGTEVVRPNVAGLMGAYGCALYALENRKEKSSLLNIEELKTFSIETRTVQCGLCNNHCQLTVNSFKNGKRYIGGNRCDRPVSSKVTAEEMNIYHVKRQLLNHYQGVDGKRGTIGLPMALNMWEMLPFWHTFFTELGFTVVTSGQSSMEAYHRAQNSIPSDTVCFPAKLVHAAIETLLDKKVDTIFYPCMTYNMKEKGTDNCFNCPVVAYYPEVIKGNVAEIEKCMFIGDFVGVHHKKEFPYKMHGILSKYFNDIGLREVQKASMKAYQEYDHYLDTIKNKGKEILARAEIEGKKVIVLAGRPYHVDPVINHGIDKLISGYGVYIVSEDCLDYDYNRQGLKVLNQWTYHSRLYAAAHYIKDKPNINLVQLVSFGCGVDAVTTDEVREILEGHGKIYTQLKIDEITNLGAVKIRLRSLMAAIEEKER